MWTLRDLRCLSCSTAFEALVRAPVRFGVVGEDPCPSCGGAAIVQVSAARLCPTLDTTSEAFERATTARAREHDHKKALPEYRERARAKKRR